jgi:hypothetical protein
VVSCGEVAVCHAARNDGRDRDRRQSGQPLLNLLVRRVIRRESEAVPGGGQHHVDAVGIVEGHGRAVQRRFVNIDAGEVRVQVTLAILPVRGETGSAAVPALGAPIIRKSGKVTGTPPRAPKVPPKAPPVTAAPSARHS